ncbi:GINS complex, Psf3 component [Lichtheimia hyalospora FSU 10163]|nr:GINS complex, Psf3 component [Lichtheimia hyalospora FSU 10163]
MQNDEYYDIDSILADSIKIPCIFLHDLEASVNLTGDGSEVTRNTRIELPFWLAKPLATFTLPNSDFIIKLEIPRPFGNRVRNNLDASPTAVDFRLLCPYFYVFGKKLVNLIEDQRLPGILEKTFKTRLKEIMDYTQTGSTTVNQDFLQKLDETEKELFKAGQESSTQVKQWRNRALGRLKAIDITARQV